MKSEKIRKLAVLAMLTAIAVVLITFIQLPLFPSAPFLKFDPADIAILIGVFAFGPMAGLAVTLIASFIQAFLLGGDGIYGFLMHFIASGAMVMLAGIIYRRLHSRGGAAIGLIAGTVARCLVMMLANHFITPFFTGMPVDFVDGMLLPVILPFNLLQGGINSVITFLIYKPVSKYVIHAELGERGKVETKA